MPDPSLSLLNAGASAPGAPHRMRGTSHPRILRAQSSPARSANLPTRYHGTAAALLLPPSTPQISPPSQTPTKQTTTTPRKSTQPCRVLFPKSAQSKQSPIGQIPRSHTSENPSRHGISGKAHQKCTKARKTRMVTTQQPQPHQQHRRHFPPKHPTPPPCPPIPHRVISQHPTSPGRAHGISHWFWRSVFAGE